MLQDIYVNTRKENKMPKVKIKFRMLTYCEKEYKIVNQELWDKNKDNFVALAYSKDYQDVFSDEREFGLQPIEDSFFEDSPNREVYKVDQVIDKGKRI